MNIEEMFPTRPEQTLAQRIIEVLKEHPDINVAKIGEHLWQRKTIGHDQMLYQMMKNLQVLKIVSCRIRSTAGEYTIEKDYFTLNSNAENALKVLYGLHKAPTYQPPVRRGLRYIVFLCVKCGVAVGARSSQKSASCPHCGYRNPINEKLEILLKTNSAYEMQSTIQMSKLQGKKNPEPFKP
jgi:DNA-directed RNA polymerase subunit RPC12/RpoP